MTGSVRLQIGIISVVGISVVIWGHFGGGDHFDGSTDIMTHSKPNSSQSIGRRTKDEGKRKKRTFWPSVHVQSTCQGPFKPRFLKFMMGSVRLQIGIISVVGISVVIWGHFGGGDHFDGSTDIMTHSKPNSSQSIGRRTKDEGKRKKRTFWPSVHVQSTCQGLPSS